MRLGYKLAAEGFGPNVLSAIAVQTGRLDAGYDHIVLMNAGPDPDGFLDFFAKELSVLLPAA